MSTKAAFMPSVVIGMREEKEMSTPELLNVRRDGGGGGERRRAS